MIKLLLRWAINAAALWVAFQFVPGIHLIQSTWPALIGLALLFGLINALLRPLLSFLTCPLIILTLGLGTLLINTLMFWLTGLAGQYWGIGFTVDGFWPAFFGALVVTLISTILTLLLHDELKGRRRERRRA
jgi:putative membrane protein